MASAAKSVRSIVLLFLEGWAAQSRGKRGSAPWLAASQTPSSFFLGGFPQKSFLPGFRI